MPRKPSSRPASKSPRFAPAVREVRVEIHAADDDADNPLSDAPPAVGDSDWEVSDSEEEYRPVEEDSSSDSESDEDLDYVSLHNSSQSSIDSDTPLSQVRLLRNQPGSGDWKKKINVPLRYGFSGQPGVMVDLDADSTAREVFDSFFTPALWVTVEEETNRYAIQNAPTPSKNMVPWKPVSKEELQSYLGLRLLMGIQPRPAFRDYWSTNRLRVCHGMY